MVSWIIEFTVSIFVLKVALDGLSDSDEVVNVNLVGDVCVKVVLEVLKHIEVGLDIFVSSDSWERESSVHEFPGVDSWWSLTQFSSNFHSVLVVLLDEMS